MKRLYKILLIFVLLPALLLAGCKQSGSATTVPAATATPEPTPAPTPEKLYEYENEEYGLACTLNSRWTVIDQAELEKMGEMAAETMEQDFLKLATSAATSTFELHAVSQESGTVINIMKDANPFYSMMPSLEMYLPMVAAAMQISLGNMGVEDVQCESASLEFLGTPCAGLTITGQQEGEPLVGAMFCREREKKLLYVTILAKDQAELDAVTTLFTPIAP